MQNKIKKAGIISSGGVLLMLLGIFLLYIKARYNIISGDIFCMRRDNFHYIDSRNIAIILAF